MAVEMRWHPDLPVLEATYVGKLSTSDYYAMCEQRYTMLVDGPDHIVLLVDASEFESFAAANTIDRCENILLHPKVVSTMIVLQEDLYKNLARTFLEARPVRFFKDKDHALEEAQALL